MEESTTHKRSKEIKRMVRKEVAARGERIIISVQLT